MVNIFNRALVVPFTPRLKCNIQWVIVDLVLHALPQHVGFCSVFLLLVLRNDDIEREPLANLLTGVVKRAIPVFDNGRILVLIVVINYDGINVSR